MDVQSILSSDSKPAVFEAMKEYISQQGFTIVKIDQFRPWGGFFVLDQSQIKKFQLTYFPDVILSAEQLSQKLSPKFLVVAPRARLSWQYHHRRAELWQLVFGEAGLIRSKSDEQGELEDMEIHTTVSLKTGERHRLVGLENWGVVAEIWIHKNPNHPSDEEDIVRLADDYNRN
jgi:mannose-6-phosphate isomerase-like protein (cupin superfamily)